MDQCRLMGTSDEAPERRGTSCESSTNLCWYFLLVHQFVRHIGALEINRLWADMNPSLSASSKTKAREALNQIQQVGPSCPWASDSLPLLLRALSY